MAKKNKRAPQSTPIINSTPVAQTEFTPDYSNTKKDLARIGILAGTFFAALIALSFFIK